MRILKLTAEGEGGFDVDLHPYVTIIQGLDETQRDRLLHALRAVPRGDDPGVGGLVEAQGVLLDLNPETLALLELRSPDTDVVVAPHDLPGAAGAEPEAAAPERGPEIDVDAVRVAAADAAAAVAALDARLAEARDAVVAAEEIRAAAAAAVEEARARVAETQPVEAIEDDELTGPADTGAGLQAEAGRLAADRADALAALEEARGRLADAEAERSRAEVDLDDARAVREAASRTCSFLAAELEEVGVGRDPSAAGALEAARAELAALEDALAAGAEIEIGNEPSDPGNEMQVEEERFDPQALFADLPFADDTVDDTVDDTADPPEPEPAARPAVSGDDAERVAELERRLDDLAASLFALSADPSPVVRALEEAHFVQRDNDLVPSEEALAVADELESLGRQLLAFVGRNDVDSDLVAAARHRLEDARVALADAENAARLPDMDRAEVQELEQAHATVLTAQERADSRFGGSRAQRKLAEAREAERAVLDRMGLTTYAEYLMGASLLRVDPSAETGLEEARNELLAAEDAWMALRDRVDEDLAHGALVDRRRELRERGRQLLGRRVADDDLPGELRELRVPTGSTFEVAARLQEALQTAGVELGDAPLPLGDLVELGDLWLVEHEASLERAAELRQELADVEAELDAARGTAQEPESAPVAFDEPVDEQPPAADVPDRRVHQLHEARAAVAAAEVRVAADEDARIRLADAQARMDEAAAAESDAASRVHEIEARLVALADAIADARAAAVEAEQQIAVLDEAAGAVADQLDREPEPDVDAEVAEAPVDAASDGTTVDDTALVEALEEADARVAAAAAELEALESERPALAERAGTAAQELDGATAAASAPPPAPEPRRTDPDEIEWFLLARLAAQRSLSYAGSVPIVLDDTLVDLGPGLTRRLLERMERMAAAVQVLYVSDDPEIAEWAAALGEERASVVHAGVPAVAVAAGATDAAS